MYLAERSRSATATVEPGDATAGSPRGRRVPVALLALGLTSFFTDISSEMVAAALPLYLAGELGFTVALLGVFDGFQRAAAIAVRLLGGRLADGRRGPKQVALAGYGLSMLTRWLLVLTAALGPVLVATGLDRVGKGLRSPARDALISRNTGRLGPAAAFGVHRAFDTAGALLGPILVFAFLSIAPGRFDTVWLLSGLAAVAGLVWLAAFVPSPTMSPGAAATGPSAPTLSAWRILRTDPVARSLMTVGVVLGLGAVGDPVVFIALRETGAVSLAVVPLLFAASALVFVVLAVPVGRLADRIGPTRVYVAGHLPLLAVYGALWVAAATPGGDLVRLDGRGVALAAVAVGALGLHYAATDGVGVAALASRLDPGLRGRAIAAFTSMVLAGRLIASAGFGLLWTRAGATVACAVAMAVVLAGLVWARRARGLFVPTTPGNHHEEATP